jgi:predicted MFS family arabinose efflux permease
MILAPPLGGWVYDRFGSDALWYACAAAGAAASLWVWCLRNREAAVTR